MKNFATIFFTILISILHWDLFSSNLLKTKLFKLYRGKISIKFTERKFLLITLLLEKFYWRKGSFNYNEKIFQLYGGKKTLSIFFEFTTRKVFSTLQRETLLMENLFNFLLKETSSSFNERKCLSVYNCNMSLNFTEIFLDFSKIKFLSFLLKGNFFQF